MRGAGGAGCALRILRCSASRKVGDRSQCGRAFFCRRTWPVSLRDTCVTGVKEVNCREPCGGPLGKFCMICVNAPQPRGLLLPAGFLAANFARPSEAHTEELYWTNFNKDKKTCGDADRSRRKENLPPLNSCDLLQVFRRPKAPWGRHAVASPLVRRQSRVRALRWGSQGGTTLRGLGKRRP